MTEETENLIKLLSNYIDSGRPIALITIISASSSTPRSAGAKMLVSCSGLVSGSIGGGVLEAKVIKTAQACILQNKSGKFDFNLKSSSDMACGGEVSVFIDVYKKPFKILILGAGHIGKKIADICTICGYPYIIADDRIDLANEKRFPSAIKILNIQPDKAIEQAEVDNETYIIIVTRGHLLDNECLAEAMLTKAAYIGMIGSRSKVEGIFRSLENSTNPLADKRVYSPIGLDLGGKSPGEIAISIIAEITKLFNKKTAQHLRIVK